MNTHTRGNQQKRAAVYVRCSTMHQDTELQRADLTAYAERRGWAIHRVYEDKGVSGAKDSRPALDAMLRDVRQGKVDVVLVWRFDRYGRSLAHLIASLNEFQSLNVDFVSHNEAIDTSTAAGRVLFAVIGAIAEFERSLIQERVRAGVRRAKDKGVKFGRPRKGFDFRQAAMLKKEGKSYREIAGEMGVDHTTVFRALRDVGAVANVG